MDSILEVREYINIGLQHTWRKVVNMKLNNSRNYPSTYLECCWFPFMTIHGLYVIIILEFVCIMQESFFHFKMKMVMEVIQSQLDQNYQLAEPIPRIHVEAIRGGEKWD